MDDNTLELMTKLIGKSYVDHAKNAHRNRQNKLQHLLEQCKLPEIGFSDLEIDTLLRQWSLMDSNNFSYAIGAGEREGRVLSSIVRQRHFGFAHGIGRSGDVNALQPKAAGSSLVNRLTNALVLDLIKMNGVGSCKKAFVVPMATGMSLTLCFLTLRPLRPRSAQFVIWPRIDQKSCLKSIYTAGFQALVVEPKQVGDELHTNLEEMERLIDIHGADNILCVMSTTSCFAPRVPDNLVKIAELCQQHNLPHVVNNAYGLMLPRCMNLLEEAHRRGRVSLFVQSTDKNFLVPVGGAVIAGSDPALVDAVSKAYPGRAALTPSLDVLVTLLSLGRRGVRNLISDQKACYARMSAGLLEMTPTLGERMLLTPKNPISLALTLQNVARMMEEGDHSTNTTITSEEFLTSVGSKLFFRGCTGARVVLSADRGKPMVIQGHSFAGYGSHSDTSTVCYLNIAAAVGQTLEEVDAILKLVKKTLLEQNKAAEQRQQQQSSPPSSSLQTS